MLRKFTLGRVVHVVKPRLNKDSVIRLQLKVFSNIIHNDGLGKITAYSGKVLDKDWTVWQSMLSVKSVFYAFLFVDLVQNPVSVLNEIKTINLEIKLLTSYIAAVKMTISYISAISFKNLSHPGLTRKVPSLPTSK